MKRAFVFIDESHLFDEGNSIDPLTGKGGVDLDIVYRDIAKAKLKILREEHLKYVGMGNILNTLPVIATTQANGRYYLTTIAGHYQEFSSQTEMDMFENSAKQNFEQSLSLRTLIKETQLQNTFDQLDNLINNGGSIADINSQLSDYSKALQKISVQLEDFLRVADTSYLFRIDPLGDGSYRMLYVIDSSKPFTKITLEEYKINAKGVLANLRERHIEARNIGQIFDGMERSLTLTKSGRFLQVIKNTVLSANKWDYIAGYAFDESNKMPLAPGQSKFFYGCSQDKTHAIEVHAYKEGRSIAVQKKDAPTGSVCITNNNGCATFGDLTTTTKNYAFRYICDLDNKNEYSRVSNFTTEIEYLTCPATKVCIPVGDQYSGSISCNSTLKSCNEVHGLGTFSCKRSTDCAYPNVSFNAAETVCSEFPDYVCCDTRNSIPTPTPLQTCETTHGSTFHCETNIYNCPSGNSKSAANTSCASAGITAYCCGTNSTSVNPTTALLPTPTPGLPSVATITAFTCQDRLDPSGVRFGWTRQQSGLNYEVSWGVNGAYTETQTYGETSETEMIYGFTPGIVNFKIRAYLGSNTGPYSYSTVEVKSSCDTALSSSRESQMGRTSNPSPTSAPAKSGGSCFVCGGGGCCPACAACIDLAGATGGKFCDMSTCAGGDGGAPSAPTTPCDNGSGPTEGKSCNLGAGMCSTTEQCNYGFGGGSVFCCPYGTNYCPGVGCTTYTNCSSCGKIPTPVPQQPVVVYAQPTATPTKTAQIANTYVACNGTLTVKGKSRACHSNSGSGYTSVTYTCPDGLRGILNDSGCASENTFRTVALNKCVGHMICGALVTATPVPPTPTITSDNPFYCILLPNLCPRQQLSVSLTPTLTTTPTLTPFCNPDKTTGSISIVNNLDFIWWIAELTGNKQTKEADCKNDQVIDIFDFNKLRDIRYFNKH
ncbi:MAG: hypothetical protein Q7T54_05920 [Candidatus Levybacteria bacterium]|nr:hypothetical protein [Candidatus Levybacteria bacterium]